LLASRRRLFMSRLLEAILDALTGRTAAGHTRDGKVERVDKLTIHWRGRVYYLNGRTGFGETKHVREWERQRDAFLEAHEAWRPWLAAVEPVYWLAEEIVKELAAPTADPGPKARPLAPMITREEAKSERAFRSCCLEFSPSVVGVWRGSPIRYEPIVPPTASPLAGRLAVELGWDEFIKPDALAAALDAVTEKADGVRHQQLAYVGWLTFRPAYRDGLRDLRARHDALRVKPPWPLTASTADRRPTPAPDRVVKSPHRLPPETAAFLDAATEFMRRWGLAALATWELPLPQGPLEQLPLDVARDVLGPGHFGSFFPGYYDVPSGQDLRDALRQRQEALGKASGVGAEFPLTDLSARAGRASVWENAFRLWIAEKTAARRYGCRRGLIARLVQAFSLMLGCSDGRVKQLRDVYRRFLDSPPLQ
jgi:hypothetical protein